MKLGLISAVSILTVVPALAQQAAAPASEKIVMPGPAAPQPEPTAPSAPVATKPTPPIELTRLRDPFKIPKEVIPTGKKDTTELQLLPIEGFTLLGVLEGLGKTRAIVSDERGKTYTVYAGTLMGNRGGVLKEIKKDRLRVLERVENVAGELENSWITIMLGEKAVAEGSEDQPEESL